MTSYAKNEISDIDGTDVKIDMGNKLADVANMKNMSRNVVERTNTSMSETPKAREQKTHKILILDWDNTILPSDYLEHLGYKADNADKGLPVELSVLEAQVCRLLTVAIDELSCDNVIVMTNAKKGWVELSALRFLPQSVRLLKRLHILSARSMFEAKYPQAFQWKHRCMHYIMQKCWKATLPCLDAENLKHVMKIHMQSYLLHLQLLHTKSSSGLERNILKSIESDKENVSLAVHTKMQCDKTKDQLMESLSSVSLLSMQHNKYVDELRVFFKKYINIYIIFFLCVKMCSEFFFNVCLFEPLKKREEVKEKGRECADKFVQHKEAKHYHIISVGDSWAERNACLVFGDILSNVFVKSIKLRERPSIQHVIQQLQQLTSLLPHIIQQQSNLDYFMP
ncbi:hypothetical protein RFI_30043 [Reticulomyxa filosa]|uniref:Uncharacterized protein n=1 Tax=Reticulomyxa filosa TaxID=46433 RepID=X6M168_RETFI|nr:hypothetical protein RFI_30043 [Reticulomyxa filosa]|eukprot:ETO07351.1 hypothetical protein RFI_30043 [Reticulomyxa filosa]